MFQSKPGETEVAILKSCHDNYSFFLENYFLSDDNFRRKSMVTLAHIISVFKGRPAAVSSLTFGLKNASSDEDVTTLLQFIRDTELWVPGIHGSIPLLFSWVGVMSVDVVGSGWWWWMMWEDQMLILVDIASDNCHPASCYLKSEKLYLILDERYCYPERKFKPGPTAFSLLVFEIAP